MFCPLQPIPNEFRSYGIKVWVRMPPRLGRLCHKVGLFTIVSMMVPEGQGIFVPYDPSFYGMFWAQNFANRGVGLSKLISGVEDFAGDR